MIQYEENTIGWWLSQLNDPLKSKAFELWDAEWYDGSRPITSMKTAIWAAFNWATTDDPKFWCGVHNFFEGQGRRANNREGVREGCDMAKQCSPTRFEKS